VETQNKDTRWIPTRIRRPDLSEVEKLPGGQTYKRSKPVLITYKYITSDKNYTYPLPCFLHSNGHWYVDRDAIKDEVNLDDYDDGLDEPFVCEIVAWQPMPEPYQN